MDLKKILIDNRCPKDKQYTHTRIGNTKLNIFPGSYHIDEKTQSAFFKAYSNKVFGKNPQKEYITESQDRINGGPILIDFDFRFNSDINNRQYKSTHINDLIELYSEKIALLFNITNKFPVFVFEKPEIQIVNKNEEVIIKDGIHVIIGLHLEHNKQLLLRKHILNDINDVIGDLELKNTKEDVVDEAITSGRNNWLMYGSRKPGGQAYKLTHTFEVDIDNEGFPTQEITHKYDETSDKKKVKLFSTRKKWEKIELKEEYEQELSILTKPATNNSNISIFNQSNKVIFSEEQAYFITNQVELDQQLNALHESLDPSEFYIKDIHQYTMALPEKYYTDYNKWIEVSFALKNTNKMLLYTFIKFSSLCQDTSKFSFDNIPSIIDHWKKIEIDKDGDKLTAHSIKYWCKKENPMEYKRIHDNSTERYIQNTKHGGGTDNDIALLIHHLFYNQFRCVSIKQHRWYSFKKHKWEEDDSGMSLRRLLSSTIARIYMSKERSIMNSIREMENITEEVQKKLTAEAQLFNAISIKLKNHSHKSAIMKECETLFYDKFLEQKLDNNPYLFCFKNGIFDFEENVFRDGSPEDYVSKQVNYEYKSIDKFSNKEHLIVEDIQNFMGKIFPDDYLRKYMWEHAASTLIGTNRNQTFNIYTGCGSNGKSMFVDLMSAALGCLKGTVPSTLITSKRLAIGQASSEIAQLKGLRYACMNEPSKGDKINEGVMKEITGGDPIQGRHLFRDTITFIPQLKLACCTNHLFDIKANDEGTWRRIRKVDFESRFVDDPNDPKYIGLKYVFKKDKTLKDSFKKWGPIFGSMLVSLAKKTKGEVEDCEKVLVASDEYRKSKDYISKFISEKIEASDAKSKISKENIKSEFKNWYTSEFDDKMPPMQELYDALDKHLGPYTRRAWHGFKIVYDSYSDDEDEYDNDIM
tara:strand:- start:3653 stop:6421 length:2769 start_codon:yes stop_codon:yes gene_type:complete